MKRSPLRRSRMAPRKTRVKRVNAKRKAANFARAYGSAERVAFVRSLPCAACGLVGYSENAHVGGAGKGAGRKSDADQIAPLCGPHRSGGWIDVLFQGCHREYDTRGVPSKCPTFNALQAAMDCDVAWQRHQAAEAKQHSWFEPRA